MLKEGAEHLGPNFWPATAVVWTACVLGMAISPMSRMDWVIATLTDKTVHGLAFAIGVIVWSNTFRGVSFQIAVPIAIGAAISLVIGGLIEILQKFVPGRSSDFGDVLADVTGILTASMLLLLKYQYDRRKMINK
jgi:VanZ family protein